MRKGQGHLFELLFAILVFVLFFVPSIQRIRFEYSDIIDEEKSVNFILSIGNIFYDQDVIYDLKEGNLEEIIYLLNSILSRNFRIWKYEFEYCAKKAYRSLNEGFGNVSFAVFLPYNLTCIDVYVDGKSPNQLYVVYDWKEIEFEFIKDVPTIANIYLVLYPESFRELDPNSFIVLCNKTILPAKVWWYDSDEANISVWTAGCRNLKIYYREKGIGEEPLDLRFSYSDLPVGKIVAYNYSVRQANAVTVYISSYFKREGEVKVVLKFPCSKTYTEERIYQINQTISVPNFVKIFTPPKLEETIGELKYSGEIDIPLGWEIYKIRIDAT